MGESIYFCYEEPSLATSACIHGFENLAVFQPLTNSSDVFTNLEIRIYELNICYDFFFNLQTEKKILFWTNQNFVFFFNCSSWEKFVEKIGEADWWKHLMNSLHVFFLSKILLGTYNQSLRRAAFLLSPDPKRNQVC